MNWLALCPWTWFEIYRRADSGYLISLIACGVIETLVPYISTSRPLPSASIGSETKTLASIFQKGFEALCKRALIFALLPTVPNLCAYFPISLASLNHPDSRKPLGLFIFASWSKLITLRPFFLLVPWVGISSKLLPFMDSATILTYITSYCYSYWESQCYLMFSRRANVAIVFPIIFSYFRLFILPWVGVGPKLLLLIDPVAILSCMALVNGLFLYNNHYLQYHYVSYKVNFLLFSPIIVFPLRLFISPLVSVDWNLLLMDSAVMLSWLVSCFYFIKRD